jgi:hypothetical protein
MTRAVPLASLSIAERTTVNMVNIMNIAEEMGYIN